MPAAPTPSESLQEYGRGVVGGLLFSLPLLYTMEVWWAGLTFAPERVLVGLAATFGLLLLYNRFAGLRENAGPAEVVLDSVEELGIGLVLAAGVLWLTGEVGPGFGLGETVGKIVVEAMTVAIGVSVGTAQLGVGEAQGLRGEDAPPPGLLTDVAVGFCGAFLVAANVAPTEEIVQIASEAPVTRLVVIAAVSVVLGGGALFFAELRGGRSGADAATVLRGAVGTYAVALVASAFLLWFFRRFEGGTAASAAAHVVVLGFPAVLGASAGRLLLGGTSGGEGAPRSSASP